MQGKTCDRNDVQRMNKETREGSRIQNKYTIYSTHFINLILMFDEGWVPCQSSMAPPRVAEGEGDLKTQQTARNICSLSILHDSRILFWKISEN
jgi:hypothetical protein